MAHLGLSIVSTTFSVISFLLGDWVKLQFKSKRGLRQIQRSQGSQQEPEDFAGHRRMERRVGTVLQIGGQPGDPPEFGAIGYQVPAPASIRRPRSRLGISGISRRQPALRPRELRPARQGKNPTPKKKNIFQGLCHMTFGIYHFLGNSKQTGFKRRI